MASSVPKDWKQAAVAITPGFETVGDPYVAVSGDFDGMGISCGALQWNIGSKSLQPMVLKAGKGVVLAHMPGFGQEMWDACSGSVAKGLAIVRGWQTGRSLKACPKAELRALMGSREMRAQQDERIDKVAGSAFAKAEKWAAPAKGKPNKRQFCWFFDLETQNGSLKGVTMKHVQDFISGNRPGRTDDLICDFLEQMKGASGHVRDAKKNAAHWRDKATGEKLELLTLTYLRSAKSLPEWRHVVINRKGSIAMGGGWVNATQYDFSKFGL